MFFLVLYGKNWNENCKLKHIHSEDSQPILTHILEVQQAQHTAHGPNVAIGSISYGPRKLLIWTAEAFNMARGNLSLQFLNWWRHLWTSSFWTFLAFTILRLSYTNDPLFKSQTRLHHQHLFGWNSNPRPSNRKAEFTNHFTEFTMSWICTCLCQE